VGAPKKNTAERDEAEFRRADAVELRRQEGLTYAAIGERLGVDRKTAWTYVRGAMAARARETAPDRDALIGEQLVYLDTVLEGQLPKAAAGDSRAAEVVLRALDSHARLFGLNAPIRVKTEITDERVARIRALAEQLAEGAE
jgi:transcriptional regulator with XRE-family HTH domain